VKPYCWLAARLLTPRTRAGIATSTAQPPESVLVTTVSDVIGTPFSVWRPSSASVNMCVTWLAGSYTLSSITSSPQIWVLLLPTNTSS
jgi:hypothetical protein